MNQNNSVCVISLHGWTGNNQSLKILKHLLPNKKIIWEFPQAPYRAKKGGHSWFKGDKDKGWENNQSLSLLENLIIEKQKNGIKHQNIFVLGFSQGGCMALELIKKQNFSLGGAITIGGFVRDKNTFCKDIKIQSKETPVLIIHGKRDEIINHKESNIIENLLKNQGFNTYLKKFSCGHKIPLEAKDSILSFLLKN
tara:strand:- start:241 stop:828 length:588 start_codon:yes stop_codon:yes gene_type:complete